MKKIFALMALMTMCSMIPAFADHTPQHSKEMVQKKADYYFDKIDSNKDGKISESEHDAFGKSMFKDADTNGDDSLSRDELAAAKMKEKEKMKSEIGSMKK